MYIVKNLIPTREAEYHLSDGRDVGDVILGITGSGQAGNEAEMVARNMHFDDSFLRPDKFSILCVREEEIQPKTLLTNIEEG